MAGIEAEETFNAHLTFGENDVLLVHAAGIDLGIDQASETLFKLGIVQGIKEKKDSRSRRNVLGTWRIGAIPSRFKMFSRVVVKDHRDIFRLISRDG